MRVFSFSKKIFDEFETGWIIIWFNFLENASKYIKYFSYFEMTGFNFVFFYHFMFCFKYNSIFYIDKKNKMDSFEYFSLYIFPIIILAIGFVGNYLGFKTMQRPKMIDL